MTAQPSPRVLARASLLTDSRITPEHIAEAERQIAAEPTSPPPEPILLPRDMAASEADTTRRRIEAEIEHVERTAKQVGPVLAERFGELLTLLHIAQFRAQQIASAIEAGGYAESLQQRRAIVAGRI